MSFFNEVRGMITLPQDGGASLVLTPAQAALVRVHLKLAADSLQASAGVYRKLGDLQAMTVCQQDRAALLDILAQLG